MARKKKARRGGGGRRYAKRRSSSGGGGNRRGFASMFTMGTIVLAGIGAVGAYSLYNNWDKVPLRDTWGQWKYGPAIAGVGAGIIGGAVVGKFVNKNWGIATLVACSAVGGVVQAMQGGGGSAPSLPRGTTPIAFTPPAQLPAQRPSGGSQVADIIGQVLARLPIPGQGVAGLGYMATPARGVPTNVFA